MAEILEQALDVALDKKDPKRKLERRKARQKVAKATPRPDEVAKDVAPGVEDEPARSRYIPSEVIERVHARANNQCQYKSGKWKAMSVANRTSGGARAAVCHLSQPR